MPYSKGYDAILLKKQICMNQSFWPFISANLALRLQEIKRRRLHNIRRVINEIALLEGALMARQTNTKPAEKLKGPFIGRFWHKHWTDTAFMPQNLVQQWWGPYAVKKKLAESEMRKVLNHLSADPSSIEGIAEIELAAKRLAYVFTKEGYDRRTKRGQLTGEWLIYYIHNGQNYYLDIAFHNEQQDEAGLLKRMRDGCEWEFPFAFD